MFSKIITLGDKVTIIQEEKQKEELTRELVSSVLDLKEEGEVHIGVPMEHLRDIPLRQGEAYSLCIYTKRGLYSFRGTVLDTYEENMLKIVRIKLDQSFERSQRRQYYRLNKIMDIRYRIVTKEEQKIIESGGVLVWNRAILSDISGGGARFYSKEALTKDNTIALKMHMKIDEKLRILEVYCDVVSSLPKEGLEGVFETRVEFTKIDTALRELIIKYVFEEDRKQLKTRKRIDINERQTSSNRLLDRGTEGATENNSFLA